MIVSKPIQKRLFVMFALCMTFTTGYAQTTIKLDKDQYGYTTSCLVNGLKLKLEIETGSTEVGISRVEAMFMIKNGYIKKEDVINVQLYESADGEISAGAEVILRKIDISGYVLNDIKAVVIGSDNFPLLIGQNALAKLGKITLDYNNNTLTIHSGPNNGQPKDLNNPHHVDNDKIDLVHVKGGTFSMGIEDGKEEEMPKHMVRVNSFNIGKFEVTVGQFRTFVEATGYRTTAESEGTVVYFHEGGREITKGLNWKYNVAGFRHKATEDYEPVLYCSWVDAQRFCEWMSTRTGKHYRLPT